MPPHSICESSSPIGLAPTPTESTLSTFGLHRPLLAQDIKKTRNAKRLSLVVPPTLGQEFEQQQQQEQQQQPSSHPDTCGTTPSLLLTRPKSSSLSTRRPFTPKPLSSASFPPSSSSLGVPPATPCARHFTLDQPSSTPTFAPKSAQKRSISAYYSNYSLEAGIASPYTWEPVKVLPGLYLGAEHNAVDYAALSRLGITSILNVAVEIKDPSADKTSGRPDASDTIQDIRLSKLQHMTLPWSHGQRNLMQEFPAAFAFIDKARHAGTNVLVHCQLGVSRSASLVIAYVMRTEKMNLSSAYEFVKDKSGVISPNMSLMYQLVEYEKCLSRSTDSRQEQQQSSQQPPQLRRSDSDSVILEKEVSSLSRRPSTNGKKSSMVIHPTPRSPLRPSAGSTLMTDVSVTAPSASRPTSPYQRVRPSTSSTSLLLAPNKSRPSSLLCLPDQTLAPQQQHHQQHHHRQPEPITTTLAKYPTLLLAPVSMHADPVPSSSDMELTEEEDDEEERDKFPAFVNRFSASPSMSTSSRAVSMASLSPPSSRPISTSESVMTNASLSHNMAMDCDVAAEPPSALSAQSLITPMPMLSTPTTASTPTSNLTTTKPKIHHHKHNFPSRHVDQQIPHVLRHDHHKLARTHDDHNDADDEEEQEPHELKVAAHGHDDIHNNNTTLFAPAAWSPSPIASGLLASSAMAVAVVASAAAKQLHHNFATAMMNSSPSSSSPSSSSASHSHPPSSKVSASAQEGSPDFIFSPRPFSPALHETRTFGEFYQVLKMEG
ncbi:hypothetical protein BGZ73_002172 [Actinomortierella ambigua]|nr:hypothetical protein BGZ73_002172 [Actinomortierella ambigua]